MRRNKTAKNDMENGKMKKCIKRLAERLAEMDIFANWNGQKEIVLQPNHTFAKNYWTLVFFVMPGIMFAADSSFKGGMQIALGIGMFISFGACVFFFGEGILEWRRGGNYGKDIVGLVLSAGGLALTAAMFTAFGMSGAALTPSF